MSADHLLTDESLWFIHKDGTRWFPWRRYSKHRGLTSFWVSDGSNLIEDAQPVDTIAELVVEVFSRGRSVWLFSGKRDTGLYRFGRGAIQRWGATDEVASMALKAGAPAMHGASNHRPLPALVAKALSDTGYDVLSPAADGWTSAAISASTAKVFVKGVGDGVLLAASEAGLLQRVGLELTGVTPPSGMAEVGIARGAMPLYEALRLLHLLEMHSVSALSAKVEGRLAGVPATERTREVRQRIGQGLFREALLDLWQGRCAVTGIAFPPQLLRASHAKPWAKATESERLDPFNGLLLAAHLDAMFDSGLISFQDNGRMLLSPQLDSAVRSHFSISEGSSLRSVAPGHIPYLAWHREFVFRR